MLQCNNFKDPGIQFYGGELFQALRDHNEKLFVQIPPPKPSVKGKGHAPLKSMKKYYNRSGGCFAGEGLVEMADGSVKRVDEVVRGDLVRGAGKGAEVLCVVHMKSQDGQEQLVTLPGGLRLTPYHPVYHKVLVSLIHFIVFAFRILLLSHFSCFRAISFLNCRKLGPIQIR